MNKNEARIVYSDMLLKYAVPDSKKKQETEAENYIKIFMADKRVEKGVKFLKDNYTLLDNAEKKYGIYKKDLVSILMWESGLGEFTGNYQIFNIFMGQILFLEKAQNFAIQEIEKSGGQNPLKDENSKKKAIARLEKLKNGAVNSLASLLRESKKNNIDPLKQLGSWGGAIGYVQFMPFNLSFVVDGDNNGTKDLFSFPDAIYSCANFLKSGCKYSKNENARKKAIYRYNASENYVKGVILYADTIWENYNSK